MQTTLIHSGQEHGRESDHERGGNVVNVRFCVEVGASRTNHCHRAEAMVVIKLSYLRKRSVPSNTVRLVPGTTSDIEGTSVQLTDTAGSSDKSELEIV